MPYIEGGTRREFLSPIVVPETPGELTFVLYKNCMLYLSCWKTPRYEDYAKVLGALESCKLELYRRHVAPYEDTKILENGDVL